MTKCAMLVKAGFDPKRLSLRKFTRTDGQDHAVCVVDEEWALDLRDQARPLTKRALGAVTPLYLYTPAVAWK